MADRNNKGWLTVKALLRGEMEQYATQIAGSDYKLELYHFIETDDFVVRLEVRDTKGLVAVKSNPFATNVDDARRWFAAVKVKIKEKES